MSDELDRSGVAGGGEADDAVSHGRTTVATRPSTRPQRPTGKRTRQQASEGGGVDVVSTATGLTESGAETGAGKKRNRSPQRSKRAKEGAGGTFRNPIVYVFNYLKQVVAELRKVIWPNQKQMVTYTSVVLVFLVFMVALIAGSDYGFAKIMLLIFGGGR